MKIGIEVEGIVNMDKRPLETGNYREGVYYGDYWNCQPDSSLSYSHIWKNEKPVELVSSILRSKMEFKKALKDLRKILGIRKSHKLKEVMYFNKSCGCHIHMSCKQYSFWRKAHPRIFIKTRYFFKKNLLKLKLPDKLKKNILEHYNRGYSEVVPEDRIRERARGREFNLMSEQDGTGIEWRAFNLLGVTTWKQLRSLMKLAYRTLRYLETQSKNWQDEELSEVTNEDSGKKRYQQIKISKPKLKTLTEKIKVSKTKPNTNNDNIHVIPHISTDCTNVVSVVLRDSVVDSQGRHSPYNPFGDVI